MIVNKHTFFCPIHFGLLHLFHLALLGQETKIVVTCVPGSLPKTIRIGRSILFSESAPKLYGLSGNLKHFFLGLIFRNADFLFIMLGQH